MVDISIKMDSLYNVTLFQIDKTSKVAKVYSQREFDKLGIDITVEQWILLKIIDEHEEISQRELADLSLRDPASITRTLDLLQKKGYIERIAIEGNRRQYHLMLTKSGSKFVGKLLPVIEALRKRSTKGLTDHEVATLHILLKKVQNNME